MLLSHSNRFMYFHIPKTGGTSLTWQLREILDTPSAEAAATDQRPGWQDSYHFDGRQHSSYIDNLRLIKEHRDYFRFAFVRNPWDLAFSWYTSLARKTHDEHIDTSAFSPSAFKNFLKAHLGPLGRREWGARNQVERGYRILMGRCQSDYVSDRDGRLQIDFVARFEYYDRDVDTLRQRLALETTQPIRMNQSRHGELDYRDYYDAESRAWIARRYRKDIELFGYDF